MDGLNLRKRIGAVFTDVHATRREVGDLRHQLVEQEAAIRELTASVAALRDGGRIGSAERDVLLREIRRAIDAVQVVFDEERENRRRLISLRRSDEYERAFTDPDALISVLIPTYRAFGLLRDRAIPSVLAQTHRNWELIVVGDAAPDETEGVVASFGDTRIRYENLPLRGPYPESDYSAWLVTAVPPFNHALRLARGQWIAPFADDDALRPNALERVLERCREGRFEFCYGQALMHSRDGSAEVIGKYPPPLARTGIEAPLQGALIHAGLRFIEQELADAIFETPSDWSLIRRMLRAGVRIGHLEDVVSDYFPSYRGEDADDGQPFR